MFVLNKIKFVIFSFLIIIYLFCFNIVNINAVDSSIGTGLDKTGNSAGFNTNQETVLTLPKATGRVIGLFLSFLGIIFFVLMIYGGFMWMTAGGNNDKVETAKKIIANATLGLIIVLSAYVITHLITTEFNKAID
ncbi:MAG: hypothetical protein GWO87_00635 [Xanthomonadaceae bacterium]|nr:hypothetical protein [Rhodospirillaceae bacterium]NIA17686.1 hypothetical protein [Xanthomonadaceae bacterium]